MKSQSLLWLLILAVTGCSPGPAPPDASIPSRDTDEEDVSAKVDRSHTDGNPDEDLGEKETGSSEAEPENTVEQASDRKDPSDDHGKAGPEPGQEATAESNSQAPPEETEFIEE